jgi:nicotinamide riboside transporter PnuC
LETKIGKFKYIFIPYHIRTYGENGVYIFVDFRIKHAGWFNYRGRAFSAPAEKASKKVKVKRQKTETGIYIL